MVVLIKGFFVDYLGTMNVDERPSTVHHYRNTDSIMLAHIAVPPEMKLGEWKPLNLVHPHRQGATTKGECAMSGKGCQHPGINSLTWFPPASGDSNLLLCHWCSNSLRWYCTYHKTCGNRYCWKLNCHTYIKKATSVE